MTLSSSCKFIFPALALVASFLSVPAQGAHADAPEKRTISLSATGAVKTTPDKVDISTGVTTEGQTAREALTKNTDAMTKVVEGLKSAGIEPKDIQTTNFSVSPIYEQRKQGQAAFITGYRVTNQVHIIVHDTEKLGEILDKVVTLGANQIDSVRFEVSDLEQRKDDARRRAMRNAIRRATLYAQAGGAHLGDVLRINERVSGSGRNPTFQSRIAATSAPIAPGQLELTVSVDVTWALR